MHFFLSQFPNMELMLLFPFILFAELLFLWLRHFGCYNSISFWLAVYVRFINYMSKLDDQI